MTISDRLRHWFHVVSNIRPIVWITSYVALTPVFAVIYYLLPDGQFRIPDGGGADFGSWLYYSIVTITTLGFGDYTPAHGWAQAVTAIEVMCGLILLGFFLNAVGSMKSEIDVTSEIEKQRRLHEAQQTDRLQKNAPSVLHCLNTFLDFCYAVTTPVTERTEDGNFNPNFNFSDMADLYKPTGLSNDVAGRSAVEGLMKSAYRTSLCLDSLQTRIDLALWPALLEDCFTFVANCQMFSSADNLTAGPDALISLYPEITSENTSPQPDSEKRISSALSKAGVQPDKERGSRMDPLSDLYYFIKENGMLAIKIQKILASISPVDTSSSN